MRNTILFFCCLAFLQAQAQEKQNAQWVEHPQDTVKLSLNGQTLKVWRTWKESGAIWYEKRMIEPNGSVFVVRRSLGRRD